MLLILLQAVAQPGVRRAIFRVALEGLLPVWARYLLYSLSNELLNAWKTQCRCSKEAGEILSN